MEYFLKPLHLILSINLYTFFFLTHIVYAGPTRGLTIKLVHMDASDSPVYPGELTREEGIRRDLRRSKARHQKLTSLTTSDIAKPPISFSAETHFYMALVGLGTFLPNRTFINYHLLVDTASDLLWVQCQGCDLCYPQVGDAYYPARSSATYSPLPCNKHDLCETGKCDGTSCSYEVLYGINGGSSYGVLASETLTVNADNDGLERIDNFVFGCGYKQKNFVYGHGNQTKTELGGILGLGGGRMSFLRQLGDRGQMKFAYCFQLWTQSRASSTYLQFGSDANIGGGQVAVYTTPTLPVRGGTISYVFLNDISIAGEPVGYPSEDLTTKSDGTGGCIFDSGTPFTLLSRSTYSRLADHLIQYFAALNGTGGCIFDSGTPFTLLSRSTYSRLADHDIPVDYSTCFTNPNGFNMYPTITFHFAGEADLEVQPEAAFYITNDIFCFAIVQPDEEAQLGLAVIIGAVQQANYRVLYDIGNRQISWAREECA